MTTTNEQPTNEQPANERSPRRRLVLARALTPGVGLAALLLAAGFHGSGLETARDTTYVAIGVLVPVALLVSARLAGLTGRDAMQAALLAAGFLAMPVALAVAFLLHALGQESGFTALWVSAVCWLGGLLVVMLVGSVARIASGEAGFTP